MDDLYREEILEHYKRPHNWGELEGADLVFEDTNPLCGDELKVMLKVAPDGTVEDVRFAGHGCAISQASASMLTDEIRGMSVADVVKLQNQDVLDLLGIEIAGVVTEVDPLVTIALAGREPFTLPPDPEAFEAAEPGQYRLRTTGEVVTDPDFLTIWTVHLARPSHGG